MSKKTEINGPDSPHFNLSDPQADVPQADVPQADVVAWEQVEPGRFMPRRVRGSCRGRALG